jgi:hypothetical protein
MKAYSEVVVFFYSNGGVEKFNLYSFTKDQLQSFVKNFGIKYDFDRQ